MMDAKRRGRLQLAALALVFLGPLALAFWLYYGEGWSPGGQAVNGELISPPIELPNNPLQQGGDARLRGVWSLLIVAPGECSDACRTALYETRQLRLALGRDRDRLQRVWIVDSGEPDLHFAVAEHPNLLIVKAGDSVGAQIVSRINPRSEVDIYLVDPLGNLMMRFPPDVGMRAMHTDVKRLLKVSHIG